MFEIIGLIKDESSPIIICAVICIYISHQFKPILYNFLEIKDLKRKRLIENHQKNLSLNLGEFLDEVNKRGYFRLCEEQFFQALIGCDVCDKKIASYILTRHDVAKAVKIYHRVKYDIKVDNSGNIASKKSHNELMSKIIEILGVTLYFLLSFFAFIPFFIPIMLSWIGIQFNINWQLLPLLLFYMFSLFGGALFILNESKQPKRIKEFCNLEAYNEA